jgi:hypothetical protein
VFVRLSVRRPAARHINAYLGVGGRGPLLMRKLMHELMRKLMHVAHELGPPEPPPPQGFARCGVADYPPST